MRPMKFDVSVLKGKLGQNTLFWFVEGLFGGGGNEIKEPVKYFMPPFNSDWCNSMFMSLDPVAIESVGYDFLRAEWDGKHKHDPINNEWESMPNAYGVDDYMHQAADTRSIAVRDSIVYS